mmetsp:Transcript_8643/g.36016  ORF Transcript_8643/g.36016 Transcript_8643/m.36016 type:complete len:222 (+) Transcript_8643:44-709(+)
MSSRRDLQWTLQEAQGFRKPKIKLEQYATTAELAASILITMDETYDDIEGKVIADFGCGCGILSIGADLLGADHVIGLDVDTDALEIAQENQEHFESSVDFMLLDVTKALPRRGTVDIVVMNPPFGTKTKVGIDALFVQRALSIAPVVYSLHKTSTRKYFMKNAAAWGAEVDCVAEMRFALPKTYKFHKQKSVDIQVDLLRFESTSHGDEEAESEEETGDE